MFPATGTKESLPYYLLYHDMSEISQGSIAVRADAAGVLTIRDSGEKIEHCRTCAVGFFSIEGQKYFSTGLGAQSIPAAQPSEACPFFRQVECLGELGQEQDSGSHCEGLLSIDCMYISPHCSYQSMALDIFSPAMDAFFAEEAPPSA
jgi:hypothetical protein